MVETEVFQAFVKSMVGELTFQEAYDKTGLILNITATGRELHDSHRILNYLTAPSVLIWSAVCASCALPYVFPPQMIMCKNEKGEIVPYLPERTFLDGSIKADLPMRELSELFNVNCFIVSQVNPWIVPFMENHILTRMKAINIVMKAIEFVRDIIGAEIKHRFTQVFNTT
jgi:predicted acylesterase/phospholipase RssA